VQVIRLSKYEPHCKRNQLCGCKRERVSLLLELRRTSKTWVHFIEDSS